MPASGELGQKKGKRKPGEKKGETTHRQQCPPQSKRAGMWDFMTAEWEAGITAALLHHTANTAGCGMIPCPNRQAQAQSPIFSSMVVWINTFLSWQSVFTSERVSFKRRFSTGKWPPITRTCLRGLGEFDSREVSSEWSSSSSSSSRSYSKFGVIFQFLADKS